MSNTVRQTHLIYCIHSVGSDDFIFLNRKYKPLGVSSDDWVKYETHETKCKIKGLNDAKAESLGLIVSRSSGGEAADVIYYLYDDATNPDRSTANWERYQAILHKVMQLVISQ